MLKATAEFNSLELQRHIIEFSRVTGRGLPEIARQALKSLVKYALDYTPPASGKTKGKSAQRAGEGAILRDFGRIGFQPVTIKGFRTITTVYGHRLANPVRVPTKINPKFEDVEGIYRARRASKHSGRFTRGGKQAWYVDRKKLNALRLRLFAAVGKLSSGWVPAARELGLPVPAWIARHGGAGRGTTVQTKTNENGMVSLKVVNHFPDNPEAAALAADTERRIGAFTGYVANGFARQLKAFYAGKWKETAR